MKTADKIVTQIKSVNAMIARKREEREDAVALVSSKDADLAQLGHRWDALYDELNNLINPPST